MAKLISVSEEAYERLKAMKEENESFTDVVVKLTRKKPLESFFGAIPEGMAKEMEANMAEARVKRRNLHSSRIKRMSR